MNPHHFVFNRFLLLNMQLNYYLTQPLLFTMKQCVCSNIRNVSKYAVPLSGKEFSIRNIIFIYSLKRACLCISFYIIEIIELKKNFTLLFCRLLINVPLNLCNSMLKLHQVNMYLSKYNEQ